jgi:phosphohistidine phosphatase SixA
MPRIPSDTLTPAPPKRATRGANSSYMTTSVRPPGELRRGLVLSAGGVFRSLMALLLFATVSASASAPDLIARLKQGGHVLLLRHAIAPGFGDPPGFRLGDCATQRNLDERGQAQAVAIGDALRARGIRDARVYSSQWCRCLETASLMKVGQVTPLPALNSFFERTQNREQNLAALRDFLGEQPADGPLLILVTHHVNIQAMTGFNVGSGEGIVLQLQPETTPRVIGRLGLAKPG